MNTGTTIAACASAACNAPLSVKRKSRRIHQIAMLLTAGKCPTPERSREPLQRAKSFQSYQVLQRAADRPKNASLCRLRATNPPIRYLNHHRYEKFH